MSDIGLIVTDPGHFHAALVQSEMYPNLSPKVHVYAPVGPDLIDYLTRISRFNTRPERPTRWEIEVHACPDFLERMCRERPGTVAMFSGRNRGKIQGILAAIEAGLDVLADRGIEALSGFADGASKDRLELDLQFSLGPCLLAAEGPRSTATATTVTRARELCERLGSAPEYPHVRNHACAAGRVAGSTGRMHGRGRSRRSGRQSASRGQRNARSRIGADGYGAPR